MTDQEKSNNENYERCKYIADQLHSITNNELYLCPECGNYIERDDDRYNDDDETYTCQECGKTVDERDLETVSLSDYFEDALDLEYRISADRKYKSVQIMVACGGPNIYVDTGSGLVELYWWSDRASAGLMSDTCTAIDELYEEYYDC